MTISVIGHGYVGLITACVFADFGNTVWVVGRTPEKIENLKRGIPPFYEPGLEDLLKRNVHAGRLKFTLSYKDAVPPSEIVFITVGTPPKKTGEADLSHVFKAAEQIGKNLDGYTVVTIKSTVPLGTNREVAKLLNKIKSPKSSFDSASAPEFLREGSAISDTLNPDRIVIGSDSPKAIKLLADLHKPIDGQMVVTSIETAELIKYASNSLLSTKISFANAMAFICDKTGADVEQVLTGVGLDKRIGRSFLYPGVGYGGSCFPKDVKALISQSKKIGYNFNLLSSVDEINRKAKEDFVQKIKTGIRPLKGKTIAVLGLSFKPNTDDMREAPSLYIIERLKKEGAIIKAFDPIAMENAAKVLTGITFSQNPYDAAKGADCIVVVTEWNEFKLLDLVKIKNLMKNPFIFDGRNIYEPEKIKKLGFSYIGVGRR
ncbi:UDP-glucose/GDP-mannose dehydrogenase family protein [Candidatus Gottesmanbacteria bacterium]|nr:UDP-glucose/GDP-mannose dehydrogenase family protein [Candidatus Gottesmanbacteria bacterium]